MRATTSVLLATTLLGACERDPPAPGAGEAAVLPLEQRASSEDLDGAALDPLRPDERADLLLFVRTDCPISNRYAPKLARMAARYADAPLDLWLVYVDPDEGPKQIREHMAAYDLPGRALRDPAQSLVERAQVRVTPEAALFDAAGALRYHGRIDDWYVGYGKSRAEPSTRELGDAIDALLAGREPSVSSAEAVGCPLPPL